MATEWRLTSAELRRFYLVWNDEYITENSTHSQTRPMFTVVYFLCVLGQIKAVKTFFDNYLKLK